MFLELRPSFVQRCRYVRNPQTGDTRELCNRICQNILANLAPGLLNNFVGSLLVVSTISYILILTPVREHMRLLRYWQQMFLTLQTVV